MDQQQALKTLNTALGWTASAPLSEIIAGLFLATFILWWSWIIVSQLSRLRSGDVTVQNALGESARALIVVLAAIALVAYLS